MSRPYVAGMRANIPPLRGGNARQYPAPTWRECAPISRPYVAGMRANVPPRRGGATGLFMIFYNSLLEAQFLRAAKIDQQIRQLS